MSDIKLTKKQTIALDALEDERITEVLFGGGAGGAKSFLGCLWIILNCLKYSETRWLIGRSKLKALKQTTLMTFFEVAKILGLSSGEHYNYNQQSGEIDFNNGAKVLLKDLFLYPSDPNFDSLGSLEITGAFLDEVNQMCHKAVQIVTSRIRYNLNKYDLKPKILMSCNPDKGWVYTEFYKPFKDGTIKDYRRFIQALATDNPNLSHHYVNNLKKLDENSKQRLLYGNWEYDSDPTKLFAYERILDMFSNEYASTGEMYITADIARLGEDKTVIYVWNGWNLEYAVATGKTTLDKTDAEIKRLAREWRVPRSNIIVDEDGVGGGLVDFGGYLGFVNNSKAKNRGNYANLKSQCYFEIAKKVNLGEIAVKFTDTETKAKLIEDLEQIKDWNSDKDEKLRVIPKDKIKEMTGRSTDYSDPFMMRMYFELAPPPMTGNLTGLM